MLVPAPERIEGLKEAGDHFYQYQPARQLAERLNTIKKGRIFITVSFPQTPNVPHQCGIAPVETTLMLDDLLRRRGVRDQVKIVYTYLTTAQLLRKGRLDNIVDVLSLVSDMTDLLDAAMVEKLARLFENATAATWTVSNAVRLAKAEVAAAPSHQGPMR